MDVADLAFRIVKVLGPVGLHHELLAPLAVLMRPDSTPGNRLQAAVQVLSHGKALRARGQLGKTLCKSLETYLRERL